MTEELDGQLGWFDQDTWCGRTCPEHSQAESQKEQTSRPSSMRSSKSSAKKLPLFLSLWGGGLKQDASAEWETAAAPFPSLTDYTMHSFGEYPNEENVSRLSQILEDSPLPKYCLSAQACEGILRRAEKRGKELPPELKAALLQQASDSGSGRCLESDG